MTKIFTKIVACAFACSITMASANVVSTLQMRLSKLENLSADYHQILKNANGETVQQSTGTIQLKRPSLFRLESKTTPENMIVGDGKTIWFYDPFVEQVTARKESSLLDNTPFVLLTNNNHATWQRYTMSQMGDTFTLMPKSPKSIIKKFTLNVTKDGKLLGFSTTEKSGQQNIYQLTHQNYAPLASKDFKFVTPEGAVLDDQR
ncbi:hypothetical protein A6A19_03140 [Actinobacillus delphinicola]|uniref:outer membrane lipoprotein chaperone LolA n=1 Tax=Actinobacillus delphinicola TaxID=51161 RepID=UPI0024436443|nr:outer membrane lipoprotein chaperone LolA [Actinobacillus delphinicola]MDG6897019.1 hypothetical protein [Actinobacillus delphinicola]